MTAIKEEGEQLFFLAVEDKAMSLNKRKADLDYILGVRRNLLYCQDGRKMYQVVKEVMEYPSLEFSKRRPHNHLSEVFWK